MAVFYVTLLQIIKRARQRHLLAEYVKQKYPLNKVITDAAEAAKVNMCFSFHSLFLSIFTAIVEFILIF